MTRGASRDKRPKVIFLEDHLSLKTVIKSVDRIVIPEAVKKVKADACVIARRDHLRP